MYDASLCATPDWALCLHRRSCAARTVSLVRAGTAIAVFSHMESTSSGGCSGTRCIEPWYGLQLVAGPGRSWLAQLASLLLIQSTYQLSFLQPCRDLILRGRCTYGDRCKYLHPTSHELEQYLTFAQLQLGAQHQV